MCDDILINVFVSICVCQIYMYLCIKLYIPVFVHQNGQNSRILCFTFLWRTNVFFVAHHFLWRTMQWCATELFWLGSCFTILWRTSFVFVAHQFLWRTVQWCATELLWLGSYRAVGAPQKADIAFCGA